MRGSIRHRDLAARLNKARRDLLLEYVDGDRFLDVAVDRRNGNRDRTLCWAVDVGLIEYGGYKDHRLSRLTEDGRLVLAYILASYADGLIQAGFALRPAGAVPPAIAQVVARLAPATVEGVATGP